MEKESMAQVPLETVEEGTKVSLKIEGTTKGKKRIVSTFRRYTDVKPSEERKGKRAVMEAHNLKTGKQYRKWLKKVKANKKLAELEMIK